MPSLVRLSPCERVIHQAWYEPGVLEDKWILPGSLLGSRGPGLQAWPPKTTLLVKAMGLGQGGGPNGRSGPVVRRPKGYQSKQWHSYSIQKTPASESLENSRHMCSVLYVQCKDCLLLSEGPFLQSHPPGVPGGWAGCGGTWRKTGGHTGICSSAHPLC